MNLGDTNSPLAVRAAATLKRLNDRHPWSHNDHFHGWIERNLPQRRRRALDVGCGRGELLERLAPHFDHVQGIDIDDDMRAQATARCARSTNATVDATRFEQVDGPYDLITMVAVLHHLDTTETLQRVAKLLSPGGRFLVVGLTPPITLEDQLWALASVVTNPVIGFVKHPRVAPFPPGEPPFPTAAPAVPFDVLATEFSATMPGAQLRRRIGFRITARWEKPAHGTAE